MHSDRTTGRIDWLTLVQSIVLLVFAVFIVHLIVSQRLDGYLHPRMLPYMIFTAVIFLLLAGGELWRGMRSEHRERSRRYGILLFIVPLCLAFSVPPTSIHRNVAETRGTRIGDSTVVMGSSRNESEAERIAGPEDTGEPSSDDSVLHIEADNFLPVLIRLYENPELEIGRRVRISGFSAHYPELGSDEFVISRLAINCCVADAVAVGLLCDYPDAMEEFPEGAWFQIDGILVDYRYDGIDTPKIRVDSFQPMLEPENVYVY